MRTSLAIACLAGVALASKSKSYRNKHTAATAERPAGDCLTEAAYYYKQEDECDDIWMAWDDQCAANTIDGNKPDECNQARDDVFGVPACAATPDVACDIGFLLKSEDQKCNDQWRDFNVWCNWWWVQTDATAWQNCYDGYHAIYDRNDDMDWDDVIAYEDTPSGEALVVMQKTQMQEVHFLQQKKRAGKKQETAAAAAPRPTRECITFEAYEYESEDAYCNDIWMAWDLQCDDDWTDACTEAESSIFAVAEAAPLPTCSYMTVGTDQVCSEAWKDFNFWCTTGDKTEAQVDECAAAKEYPKKLLDDAAVMRKTQMQTKHSIKEMKRAGKKQQTVVAVRPAGDCLNWDAREYKSDTTCDATWRVWDEFCVTAKSAECKSVRKDMQKVARLDLEPPLCSFILDSDQEWCSRAWDALQSRCYFDETTPIEEKTCDASLATMWNDWGSWLPWMFQDTDADMRKTTMQRKHELKKSAAGKHALERTAAKERSGKKASVNLAASSSAANDGQYASGVAMGAAVGAAAALGALVAISKCNKGRVDDFQRV